MFVTEKIKINRLPKSYSESFKCHFRMTGGMGDVLICSGVVSSLNCVVDVSVPPHLVPLIQRVQGIRKVFRVNTQLTEDYDLEANFDGIFATYDHLVDSDYYQMAADKINAKPKLAKLDFKKADRTSFDFVLHPSSSNPNRSWGKQKWFDLANSLSLAGKTVAFLGTPKEPGFSHGSVFKLSDISDNLVWQIHVLCHSGAFIGNDSGFAHLAGLLGVSGHVLFFNTKPENVIAHYPSLQGICGFSDPSECTGNLNPLDPKSKEFEQNITCEKVCEKLGISYAPIKVKETLPELRIIGSKEKVEFFTRHLGNFVQSNKSSIVLDVDKKTLTINGTEHVFLGGPYDLVRFLISKGAG